MKVVISGRPFFPKAANVYGKLRVLPLSAADLADLQQRAEAAMRAEERQKGFAPIGNWQDFSKVFACGFCNSNRLAPHAD
jgi:hypothetical protein